MDEKDYYQIYAKEEINFSDHLLKFNVFCLFVDNFLYET